MIVFKKAQDISDYISRTRKQGASVGFVPTMGALHHGHLALIKTAQKENELTVCSIFVNPTQFNNADDFSKYPITIEKDVEQLVSIKCDCLFLPPKEEIYPQKYTTPYYRLDQLETVLEGKFRPGHFQGVCQVVDRLLQIIEPANLYLGAKDFQQCMVIRKLLEITNRLSSTNLNIVPTIREADGLAMSSRNMRMSPEQRKRAPALYQALNYIKNNFQTNPITTCIKEATNELQATGFQLDYLEVVDAATLFPSIDTTKNLVIVVAAYLGDIRLIDNLPLH